MGGKRKFYAVRKGNECGIFSSWKECQTAVEHYPDAEFKSFLTEKEAQAYLDGRDAYEEEVARWLDEGWGVAFVDGSFDESSGKYGSGVVAFAPGEKCEEFCRAGKNPKYVNSRNVAGEIFAALQALEWAVCRKISKLKIYHDYEGIQKWLSNGWKVESPIAKTYVEIYKNKYEGILKLDFIKVKGHSNNKYNEIADQLAKAALNEKRKVVKGESFTTFSGVKKGTWNNLQQKLKGIFGSECWEHSETTYKISDTLNTCGSKVTLTFYPGSKKVVLQGALTSLFQEVLSEILAGLGIEESELDRVYSDVYRAHVDSADIENKFQDHFKFPADYPQGIKNLVRTSLINLSVTYDCPDYSHFVFSALKAVEGHLKYLFHKNGITVSEKGFGEYFDGKTDRGGFKLKNGKLTYAKQICEAYSFWQAQRHTIFHYGVLLGKTDSTREIKSKREANEIIHQALMVIQSI